MIHSLIDYDFSLVYELCMKFTFNIKNNTNSKLFTL